MELLRTVSSFANGYLAENAMRRDLTHKLRLIDELQAVGNSFNLDSIDLHCATTDRG
jgi:hypothetical protein